ncbi:MAG: hypothetical protein RXN78_07600 [Vulcanisaeta sp.]
MRRIRCIAVSAEGGFKIINGSPKMGKDPMESKEVSDTSNETSPSRPTQAGRIELCQETIKEARRCLENNDKDCITRLIEELVRNQCHDGRLIGKEVADSTRGIVHKLWLSYSGDDEHRCRLLMLLRSLGVSKGWVRSATRISDLRNLNKWLGRCGISWKSRATRNNVVRQLEDLLRERFGWSEIKMCEKMWRFIGVDVNEFRRHGIEPCIWLEGINELSNLRNPYWLGLRVSDLTVGKIDESVRLDLGTSNTIDAIFFLILLGTVKASLEIKWGNSAPAAKYTSKPINLLYYVVLNADTWPWPIKLNADELEKMIKNFNDKELAMFIAGALDGDGSIWYNGSIYVTITVCKNCPKRFILDMLKKVIAERFGIVGSDGSLETADALKFGGEDTVRLFRLIRPFVHHPLRRLRIELILALYDRRISREAFEKLYEITEYEYGGPDVKRNHALEVVIQAAPQTHTHGEQTTHKKELNILLAIRVPFAKAILSASPQGSEFSKAS